MRDAGSIKVNATCPKCNVIFKVSLSQLANEAKVVCPNNHTVQLADTDNKAKEVLRSLGGKASQIFR